MHLSRILDQIKRHPSPTEALTKLGKAMDKHEDNLLEKGFRILKSELCANVYEAINGPHFDEEHAKYAVEGMENEDGSKGPHWTVEETTSIANQMGINLKSEKHNKWDWYVAMNMIYSDFYKAVVAMTGGASTKHFAELTKAWICDKDILKLLNTTPDITTNVTKDFKELDELKAEVKELKQLLQNVTTVRPEVNEKVPQAEEKQIEI